METILITSIFSALQYIKEPIQLVAFLVIVVFVGYIFYKKRSCKIKDNIELNSDSIEELQDQIKDLTKELKNERHP